MKNLQNINLLLIEDDTNLRNELEETLAIFFKKIYSAINGKEALDVFAKEKIDIIFTDYVMPVMDGCSFAKEIRKNDRFIPIVFITNYTDKEKLLNLMTLNITDFLIKPINYDNLIESLEKLNANIKQENEIIITDKIKYIPDDKILMVEEKEISLTKNEIIFIEILVKNLDSIIEYEALSYAFSDQYKSEQAIKNLIYRLNQKIKIEFLKNIQGVGYKIVQ
mgnify:CR=1 FL=1